MKVTKDILYDLYIVHKKDQRECASIIGCKQPTISRGLRVYGIKSRTGGFQKGAPQIWDKEGENSSRWKGGKKEVPCAQCGKRVFRFPSTILERIFCGRMCAGKWMTENLVGSNNPNWGNTKMVGEGNPNWQGGIACEPYAPIWVDKRFKSGIRERDNHACQNPDCRKNSDVLTAHHIDYDKKNCEPENLITLCNSCNCRANYSRDFWEAGYKAIIQEKYRQIGSVSI